MRTTKRARISRLRRSWARSLVLVAPLIATIVAPAPAAMASPACPNSAFRTGPSAALPDCRAYEQVSPVEKGSSWALSPDRQAQAAPSGEAVSFVNLFSAYANPQSASLADAYVSKRTSQGWLTTNVSPPTPAATAPGGAFVRYQFSEELNQWLVDLVQPLAEGATPGIYNLFLSGEGGGYRWINNATPASVPPTGCPSFILVLCFQFVDVTASAGASADFRHILFESTASLLPGAPEGRQNLYESAEEGGAYHVKMAGVLPDGKIAEESTAGSESNANGIANRIANAISQNGERVVFEALSDEGQPAESGQAGMMEVYERLGGSETVELSKPAPGATPANTAAQPAMFWGASTDGKHVFFTSKAELTSQSYTGAPVCNPEEEVFTGCGDRGDLYEYDLETETLKDLTVDTNLPADVEEGASVQGVLATSADGAYVYFVAKGQLVPGKGVDGGYNLYVVHNGGAPAFIATLNEADGSDWAEREEELQSYLTPSGRHLAFTSVNPLATTNFPSGYNNVNEGTGSAERETYEYSAATESVVCVSCDPSGAPPIGAGLLGSVGRGEGNNAGIGDNSTFHQARAVSNNGGRVFFTSRDPLVSGLNGNTKARVYEYEQEGEGTCETTGGCIYLLSSPTSPEAAYFVDADSTGNNVFLATLSQLTPNDADQLYDVYDSRVDGGLQSPATAVPCSSSCRAAGEPLSTTSPLSGANGASGNLRAAKRPTETRADKLAKALKACRKEKGKRKRRSCRARARKRYGAPPRAHRSAWFGRGRG